jgi:predicted PhzF superfamily epimerase YddE/YHI9
MRIPYFQVNAFTRAPFRGNPAGVCVLENWLPNDVLQQIAAENNLSETAFFTTEGDRFHLRWMTPTVEVDLCGHATLATAAVLFFELGCNESAIQFQTKSGTVLASRRDDLIELDFPSRPAKRCVPPKELLQGLGTEPREVYVANDYVAILESEEIVRLMDPDMNLLKNLDRDGVIITARGSDCDFVSRYFAPHLGIPEDPVTGSAHCTLIPLWAERIGKKEMFARQVSQRGGELFCRLDQGRVAIGGHAVVYKRGEIQI